MRFALVLLIALFASSPAAACEVGAPFDWNSETPCSDKAHAIMERIGSCLHWAGEEGYSKKRAAEITKAMKDQRCERVMCDYDAAAKDDHAAIKEYVERQFTNEKEFRLTFPPAKSCKAPAAKKPAAKKKAATVKTTAAKTVTSKASAKPVTTKSKPSTSPKKKEK
jgi:hypothetical protein